MRRPLILGLALAAASTLASAQQSEVPLWLNLTTAQGLMGASFSYRFTILATNVRGTTANQVLGGDYAGTGPNRSGQWGLGFHLVRIFK